MAKRYTNTGHFGANHYDIVCPRCSQQAVVSFNHHDGYYYQWHKKCNSRLLCRSCGYTEKPNYHILYDATLNIYCPDCGVRNTIERKNLNVAPQSIEIQCSHCNNKHSYKPSISTKEVKTDNKGLKADPMFNYPLWRQTTVCGNLFWAYNCDHLEEMKLYVEADLRERNSAYLMTMVARLPKFIQSAKNRDKILAAIDKLKNKTTK